VPDLDKVRS